MNTSHLNPELFRLAAGNLLIFPNYACNEIKHILRWGREDLERIHPNLTPQERESFMRDYVKFFSSLFDPRPEEPIEHAFWYNESVANPGAGNYGYNTLLGIEVRVFALLLAAEILEDLQKTTTQPDSNSAKRDGV